VIAIAVAMIIGNCSCDAVACSDSTNLDTAVFTAIAVTAMQ